MSKDNPRRKTPRFNSETDFNPSAVIYGDWHEDLQLFLIDAGIHGRTQTAINNRFRGRATMKNDILPELEALRAEGKVQKFTLPPKGPGRAPIVWRATEKILED